MTKSCIHCNEQFFGLDSDFCCIGCAAAYKIVNDLGFDSYYRLRKNVLNENNSSLNIKPDQETFKREFDSKEFIYEEDGIYSASFMIDGISCAACVWLIENIARKDVRIKAAQINLSSKTIFLRWCESTFVLTSFISTIEKIGYKFLPLDLELLKQKESSCKNSVIKELAVSGFGVGNVMLISFVLWFYNAEEIGLYTKELFHLFSALIGLPIIIYSSRPFFKSAINSIRFGYPNMDLAICLAIFLASTVSLIQVFTKGSQIYFDSVLMLIFFLLIGRYLEEKVKKRAFDIVAEFSLLLANFGNVEMDGKICTLPIKKLQEGMILRVSRGEKIAADGDVIDGKSQIDNSIISGESVPKEVGIGSKVFAGAINLGAALKIRITAASNNNLLSQIISIVENIENNKSKFIRMTDRIAKFYTPSIHILAIASFVFWMIRGLGLQDSMMIATAILIITCPCALALAVPIVQTIFVSNFIKRGVFIKSGEVIEKLSKIDVVVFDKTGSLTTRSSKLIGIYRLGSLKPIALKDDEYESSLILASSIMRNSKHPLAQAIIDSYSEMGEEFAVSEIAGCGLIAESLGGKVILGRQDFCGLGDVKLSLEIENSVKFFLKSKELQLVFLFEDSLKLDAAYVISRLKQMNKKVILLSGDTNSVVSLAAKKLGIKEFYFEQNPIQKLDFLYKLKAEGMKVMMVGDGINDAPSLAVADISLSFSDASDISQNVADIIIRGSKLAPIIKLISEGEKALRLMKQNLSISVIYNLIAIPFAFLGFIVPLLAALAMSSSSLMVMLNSMRVIDNVCTDNSDSSNSRS